MAAMAEFELGAEEAVKDADIRARDRDVGGEGGVVREAFAEDSVEVVAHFGFEHDGFIDVEAETCADAGEIGLCLGKVKIIGIDAGLHVIVLGERSWCQANNQYEQQKPRLHGQAPWS
jgi:hypothetical protein